MSSSRRGCHLPSEQGGDLLPNGLARTARPSHQLASMEQPFLMPSREPNGGPGLGAPIPPLRRPNDRETRQSRFQNQCPMEYFNMEQNFGNSYNPQMELNEGLYESSPVVRGPGHLGRGLESVNGHPTHEMSNRTLPAQINTPEMMFGNFPTGFMPQPGGVQSGIKDTAKNPFMMNAGAFMQRQQQQQQFGAGRILPGMYPSPRNHMSHQMMNDYSQMEANLAKHPDLQLPNGVQKTTPPPHQNPQQRGHPMSGTLMQNSQQMSYEQQQQHSSLNDRRMQNNTHQNPQRVSSLIEYQAKMAQQKTQNQPDRTRHIPPSITNRKVAAQNSAQQYFRAPTRGVNFGHQTNPAGLRMHRSSPQSRAGLRESGPNIKSLIQGMMRAVKFCRESFSRNRDSRLEEFGQQAFQFGQYFANCDRKLHWSKEEETEVRQRVNQGYKLLETLQKIKEQMDSPLSNTTVVNSQFMEPEGVVPGFLNQDLAGPLEPPQVNPEEQRRGMRPLERTKGPGEVDLAPAESSNRHQGLTKERTEDNVIDLYHTDESEKPQKPQKESLKADTHPRVFPTRTGGDRTTQVAAKNQKGNGLSPGNEDLRTLSKNKAPTMQQEANSGKKRGSGQQPSVQNERGSRRRVDPTNLAQSMMTGPWEEPPGALTGASPEPKEVEEDRGSTDGIKEVKKVVENHDGDCQDLEELLKQLQNKEQDHKWQLIGLEFDSTVNQEEWRFERGVLSSICSSIPVQDSTVSSTNKVFRPELSKGPSTPLQITKDEDRTSEIDKEESLDLSGRIQTECKDLLERLDHQSGSFTYQTSVLDSFGKWKEIRNEQQAALVLDCKRPSKVCCEIRLLIDAAYPDITPDISFNTPAVTNPWFNSWFLRQIEELGLTSVAEILQFWTELDTSMYPSS